VNTKVLSPVHKIPPAAKTAQLSLDIDATQLLTELAAMMVQFAQTSLPAILRQRLVTLVCLAQVLVPWLFWLNLKILKKLKIMKKSIFTRLLEVRVFLPTERNLAGKSISTLTPQQLKDYFKGYLQGTHFLDGYPPCDLVNDSVLQTLKQMIDSFQNIKSIKDVSKLKELLPGMKNLLMSLILQAPSCYSSGKQIQDLFARLVAYVTIPTYPVSLGLHITGNIFKVFTMVSDYLSNFERRDAFENGVKAGEFLKFLMFWDFK